MSTECRELPDILESCSGSQVRTKYLVLAQGSVHAICFFDHSLTINNPQSELSTIFSSRLLTETETDKCRGYLGESI